MEKYKVVGGIITIFLLVIIYSVITKKETKGIIGVDIEEDSVKIVTFNLRYGKFYILF